MLKDILPAKPRSYAYAAFAAVGLTLGSFQVWFSAAGGGEPGWLVPSLAVYAFVGTGFGFTAKANVTQPPAEPDPNLHDDWNPAVRPEDQ